MLDLDEINEEIEKLENGTTTFANCSKLANLYIVREHYGGVSRAKTAELDDSSDFVGVCMNISKDRLISVLNEHMQAIQALYPKEYNLIIKKLKEL